MTVSFYTLGCKVNQLETEALAQRFSEEGFTLCPFDGVSDVYVINTCTVTGESDRKCRQAIRRTRLKNPGAILVVTGCYAQIKPDEVEQIGGVDIITGTRDRMAIVGQVLKMMRKNKEPVIEVCDVTENTRFERLAPTTFYSHTRASVKIQDGCQNYCAYCVIPYARGVDRSMDFSEAVDTVKVLADQGFLEIVLTGIHIASYGRGTGRGLLELLMAVNEIPGNFRIRLGSLNPSLFTDNFTGELAPLGKICPHFHISLQSGCDKTLKDMNRRYTKAQFRHSLENIRRDIPDALITTDIIVGFPGETEEDFCESADFVRECGFLNCHIFPYSKREGTAAAVMEDQVANSKKTERAKVMAKIAKESRMVALDSFIGKELDVLFETEVSPGEFEGYSQNYIPVRSRCDKDLRNRRCPVLITKNRDEYCEAEIKRTF